MSDIGDGRSIDDDGGGLGSNKRRSSEDYESSSSKRLEIEHAAIVSGGIGAPGTSNGELKETIVAPNSENSVDNNNVSNNLDDTESMALDAEHEADEQRNHDNDAESEAQDVNNNNDAGEASGTSSDSTDVSKNTLVVEFVDKSKEENLIHDKGTVKLLLINSPIWEKSTKFSKFLLSAHKVVLHIIEPDDVTDLLGITQLNNAEGAWPIQCYRPVTTPGLFCFGVLKGFTLTVRTDRIKANLITSGVKNIVVVTRIENRKGPTTAIKIKFNGTAPPSSVNYVGDSRMVHPYFPPNHKLLCHRCGRGGHKYIYCRSKKRCP